MPKNHTWRPLAARYTEPRPHRMLALDGGGIRGVLTLCMLERIEALVRKPLGEYFDYIAGTSTGAIIASGLARGMTVAELSHSTRAPGRRCSSALAFCSASRASTSTATRKRS